MLKTTLKNYINNQQIIREETKRTYLFFKALFFPLRLGFSFEMANLWRRYESHFYRFLHCSLFSHTKTDLFAVFFNRTLVILSKYDGAAFHCVTCHTFRALQQRVLAFFKNFF